MKWRGRTLTVDSPMPAKLSQHHWSPRAGDRVSAWRHVPPGQAIDGNLYPLAGDLWFLHWPIPLLNGYTRCVDPRTGHLRRMSLRELHRGGDGWGHNGIKTWRDKYGQAPMTHAEGLAYLTARQVVAAQEVKGPRWSKTAWPFQHLHANCAAAGHPAWTKRIATLRFPKATVARAHAAHVKIAAIYGHGVRGRARRLARTRRLQARWGHRGPRFDATW